MSTVATITPYESSHADDTSITDATTDAGEFIADSLKDDERQNALLQSYREEERSKRLVTSSVPLKPACVTLKLTSAENLVRSAESIGYRLSPLTFPANSLEAQPKLILNKPNGESLIVKRNMAGRLDVEANGGVSSINRVVVKHSLDMIEKTCGAVKIIKKSHSGEISLESVENKRNADGQAKITAHIKKSGEVVVDVSNVKGKRCESIIQDIARAVGGESVETSRKTEYFQTAEERGKVRA